MKDKLHCYTKGIMAFILLLTLLFSFIGFMPMRQIALAESIVSPQDEAMIKSLLLRLAEDEGYDAENVEYEPFDVYYPDETWAGCDIEFNIEDTIGYGIFFKIDGMMTMVEISFESHSPFFGKEGMYIYPKLDTYYIKTAEGYFDAKTDEVLTDYNPNDYFGAKGGSANGEAVTKTYNYTFGRLYTYEIPGFWGYTHSAQGHKNDCANVAGVTMLNYWNNYFDNDLLNETRLNGYGDLNGDAALDYMHVFYDYMKTNQYLGIDLGIGGTRFGKLKSGFEKLIKEKGYRCQMIDFINSTYENNVNALKIGMPFFVQSSDYYFTANNNLKRFAETDEEKEDRFNRYLQQDGRTPHTFSIEHRHYNTTEMIHVFVIFGYGYYDMTAHPTPAVSTKYQIRFYKIFDGWDSTPRYFNIDESVIDDMCSVKVYK